MASGNVVWQPQPAALGEILELLRQSSHPGLSNEMHRQIQTRLHSLNAVPDFNNYLVYIFTQLTSEDESVRTVAGLLLKNNVRSFFPNFSSESKEYIKSLSLSAVGDNLKMVRNTAGSIITNIVIRGGLAEWPNLLPTLIQLLEHPQYEVVEGAIATLDKICEDHAGSMDSEELGWPLNYMIPKFLDFFEHPQVKIRVYAIHCVNQFITTRPNALIINLDRFIQGLYNHATDESPDIRQNVCQGLVMLFEILSDRLMGQVNTIIEYMLHSTQDPNPQVALEACGFWLVFVKQEVVDILIEFLPRLIPVLLKGMVYDEKDIEVLQGNADDYDQPDDAQSIRPRATRRLHNEDRDIDLDDDEDEDEGGDEDFEDEIYAEWNLRKCSAAALDMIALVFPQETLELILPLLEQYLQSERWEIRECGILALGAIADGCMMGIQLHLPNLFPFLMRTLNDPKPLIRTISCWTLSRYCSWCIVQPNPQLYFEPLMAVLLDRILDSNKRVQQSACSAFIKLEEEANLSLVPYLGIILPKLVQAFDKYQSKNLLMLYDVISILADCVGSNLNVPQYIEIMMKPLMDRWNKLADDDTEIIPLLECLPAVAIAFGLGFLPFAPVVFERCVKWIHRSVANIKESTDEDSTDRIFLKVSFDLLSGVVEGLGASSESLVARYKEHLMPLLMMGIVDAAPDVRRSALALVGDISLACFYHLQPYLPQMLSNLVENIAPNHSAVCNNACWALGAISLQYGDELKPYVLPILERILDIWNPKRTISSSLLENTAITIGRIGRACPNEMAPHLGRFFQNWCRAAMGIRDLQERETAFHGICSLIELNPQGAVENFSYFCEAVANYENPPPDLGNRLLKILHAYKNSMGDNWKPYFEKFSEETQTILVTVYQL